MTRPHRPLVYAHRGASADHAENTLAAFNGAREQGSDWVELDVHLAADGALVICHDGHYSDGRAVWSTPSGDRPETVPLLDEALDACAGMGVNIEIKVSRPDTEVAAVVAAAVIARRDAGIDQPICISSFDEATLAQVRDAEPSIDTAQLLFDLSLDPTAVERAAESGAIGINPWDPFVDRALVERCAELGLVVTPWTVDDRDRIVQLASFGVDGIITNSPALARSYLD
ncbi:MAG: glycerophosphodiester phosphodiesterase [Microthrixaceae bacterium]